MNQNSNNPLIGGNRGFSGNIVQANVATKAGITFKTILGLLLFVVTLYATMNNSFLMSLSTNMFFFVGTFVFYIVGIFKMRNDMKWAKRLFFFYPIMQGILLASFIGFANMYVPGIALQALIIVILIFAFMIIIYQLFEPLLTKLIPLMFVILLFFFGIQMLDFIFQIFGGSLYAFNSDFGLFMSIGFVILASFSYVTDFKTVSMVTKNQAPKEYEYYAALGLLITTIWLYVEVLRLLLVFASRNND